MGGDFHKIETREMKNKFLVILQASRGTWRGEQWGMFQGVGGKQKPIK